LLLLELELDLVLVLVVFGIHQVVGHLLHLDRINGRVLEDSFRIHLEQLVHLVLDLLVLQPVDTC
jgi:hypothetical protein